MTVIFFDTETTGIGEADRLCQLAIVAHIIAYSCLNVIHQMSKF